MRLHSRPIGREAEKLMFADLKMMLINDYENQGRKSLRRTKFSIAHLDRAFGRSRAIDITADRVSAYIRERREATAQPATVQNELSALERMFTLAIRARKLTPAHRPYIESLKLNNVRQGFFEEAEFRAVLAQLPDDAKPIIAFLYYTGWRIGEVLALTWRQVDFVARIVRLEPGTTKNNDGREFPFAVFPELEAVLRQQRERTDAVERVQERIITSVFHRGGKPIKSIRSAWKAATKSAGIPNRIPHDFRRTAVRRLERAGVSRSGAMKLTGHLTESVFRRYAIVSPSDLKDGVAKLAALHASDSGASRTVVPLDAKRAARQVRS